MLNTVFLSSDLGGLWLRSVEGSRWLQKEDGREWLQTADGENGRLTKKMSGKKKSGCAISSARQRVGNGLLPKEQRNGY